MPTDSPTPVPAPVPVASVLDPDSEIDIAGGRATNKQTAEQCFYMPCAINGKIARYTVVIEPNKGPPGFEATPSHGSLSIVQGLRVYVPDRAKGRDPTSFLVQGRLTRVDPWTTIGQGSITVPDQRNTNNANVTSTYASADTSKNHGEVLFPSNTQAFLTYRVVFPTWKDGGGYQHVGEVELPGLLVPGATTTRRRQLRVA